MPCATRSTSSDGNYVAAIAKIDETFSNDHNVTPCDNDEHEVYMENGHIRDNTNVPRLAADPVEYEEVDWTTVFG